MTVSNFDHLPRLVSLHQLARRTGIHRNALTLLMARGHLRPSAMQSVGGSRESFLFPVRTIEAVGRTSGLDQSLL
jgi:hypothetical protein